MSKSKPKKFLYLLLSGSILFLFFIAAIPFLLQRAGLFLIEETTSLKPAEVAIILGGTNEARVKKGVALFQHGAAKKLLMTGSPFYLSSEPELMSQYAQFFGVPSHNILLETASYSTYDHAVNCLPILKKMNVKSIIIVTSKYHTRRSKWIFHRVFKQTLISIQIVGADDAIPFQLWWKDHEATEKIVMEWGKLVWYWFKF